MRAQRRQRRERLRRPCMFSRDGARRHSTLLDRKDRSACYAVEHEHHSSLGCLDYCWLSLDGGEKRWRRVVVVPEVVMHRLEMPDDFSRRRAQGHDRVGVVVATEALATVIVRSEERRVGKEWMCRWGAA